jgi:hypothetical protein
MCLHLLKWHYFNKYFRACRKCGECQEKIHHTGMTDVDCEWDSWEEILYDDFIIKVNNYANWLMKNQPLTKKQKDESKTKMRKYFENILEGYFSDREMRNV